VQAARAAGARAVHKPGLGNTAILVAALANGAIDAYPEYTGTILREIVKTGENLSPGGLAARLRPLGLAIAAPLGFSAATPSGCAAITRRPAASARSPISRAIRRCAWACPMNSSVAATAGRG
jgi:Periplasmic glycine betaine/choline-binding (lipo)protein of an ABC-type transport system (osmoprotectant binding protein)